MFAIEFAQDQEQSAAGLAEAPPQEIRQVKTRHSLGGGHELSLIFSLAALAIPAVKVAVVEFIRSGRFKSFSYKGMKFTGHSAEDISQILRSFRIRGSSCEYRRFGRGD
jgi:hypothetical protein